MQFLRSPFVLAATLFALLIPTPLVVATGGTSDKGSVAEPGKAAFDGTHGWGDAQACEVSDDGMRCFRTEAQLIAYQQQHTASSRDPIASRSTRSRSQRCTTSLRLYSAPAFTGRVLYLNTRNRVVNLSAYGFDNVTSSFKNGSCTATLRSRSHLRGATYPARWPWSSHLRLWPGWDNSISSVYLR